MDDIKVDEDNETNDDLLFNLRHFVKDDETPVRHRFLYDFLIHQVWMAFIESKDKPMKSEFRFVRRANFLLSLGDDFDTKYSFFSTDVFYRRMQKVFKQRKYTILDPRVFVVNLGEEDGGGKGLKIRFGYTKAKS